MIEFKGTYFQNTKSDPINVLVQYDGVLLHVWHLPEPFHRLFSSDVFHMPISFIRERHVIKFPNGSHVETDDSLTFNRLFVDRKEFIHHGLTLLKRHFVLAFISAMAIILGAWWLLQKGFLL